LVAQPPRFPLHWDDFLPRRNGTVAIYVYEAAEAIIQADTMVKVCSLVWSKDGVDDLRAAFQKTPPHLVELAVDCAGDSVDFKVYINGESQSSGATAGFEVRYKMKGSTY
jgi:phosphoribosyl-AMP cyclohydrolase